MDDHGFHRGDGVFEALRGFGSVPYLLGPHLARMRVSAEAIGIEIPYDDATLTRIVHEGLERFGEPMTLLRLFATRGPGGFSTNPQECLESCFFCVISAFRPHPEDRYLAGATVGRSQIPMKPPWMAVTKSLNYLPNVMMKREALSRGIDFVVGFDESGAVGESSTENLVVLTRNGELAHPPLERILRGCTMIRLFDLVEERRILPTRRGERLTEKDLLEAQGLFMVGTTWDVLPVSHFEGRAVARSKFENELKGLILADQSLSASLKPG